MYAFDGHYDGNAYKGEGGDVLLNANAGDIVAFGQRDNRKGTGTENDWYVVEADGSLTSVTQAEAREHFNASKKVAA